MTTITSSSSIGISLSSPSYINPVVINPGVSISSTADGVSAATGFWMIENYGSIAGAAVFPEAGIYLKSGGSVTNATPASITGYDGVKISSGAGTVVNNGSIAGATHYIEFGGYGVGIALASGGSVTNAASASI